MIRWLKKQFAKLAYWKLTEAQQAYAEESFDKLFNGGKLEGRAG